METGHWGWGDGLTDALGGVRARAESFFGKLSEERPRSPRVPAPRVEIPRTLRAFSTAEAHDRAMHTWGKSYVDRVRGFRGDFSAAPDFVVRPRTEAELETVLEVCERNRLAAIPFGGGTSVVGGVEPRLGKNHQGSATVDLRAMCRVLEVDDISCAACIEAGAVGPVLERQLAPQGFTLRHFPQSFEFSTLGGWIATRAGGHFATLYTHIDEMVESIRMLTPRGVWQTKRFPSSGAGPNPDRLVCGSEGTLGVITQAWVRIHRAPVYRASASIHFRDFAAAAGASREISQSGLFPANCRLLDAQEALLNQVSTDGASVLLLAFESADHPLDAWLERGVAVAEAAGGRREAATTGKAEAAESWRSSFLKGPYLQDAMIVLGVLADSFETACTWAAFPGLYAEVMEATRAALDRVCGCGLVTCRFTHVYPDGPAPYFTFLGKAKRGGEVEQWAEVKQAASDALVRAGGTITHHHAVGRTHRPWFDQERPEPFARALRAMKRELDPAGILNPGVLFD
jgi:alkyldihydroxyacetonephosphate synthase